ncbi:MAG: ABC transporter ATP-binding protein [Candidatus Dadabacteria bacterium]|nr:MAG: ABC transporter ATP-binding protein [Candidatus Dadabacteria bacterium]
MAPLLELNNVEVVYNHAVLVLKGLSLRVPEGGIVALLGTNGAGKSTTLKAISGLLPLEDGEVTDGDILYEGQSIRGRLPHEIARRGLVQVLEGRRIFEDLTVEENLAVARYARKGRPGAGLEPEAVYAYFPRLRERRRQTAGYLSGGEQQMLAIGRALVAGPRLLLLDEPSLGLAPLLVEEIFGILVRINREEGVTMLLVEQNAAMALEIASFGYIMEGGRVVLEGPRDVLLRDRDVQEFYLGVRGGHGAVNYRAVKHYKRRKRWLS